MLLPDYKTHYPHSQNLRVTALIVGIIRYMKALYKHLPKTSGVYQIVNKVNGKFYIGSTYNLRKRWIVHIHVLRRSERGNSKLKAAWRKYGEENFEFRVLIKSPIEYLIKLEQWFIDNLSPEYNTRKEAAASNKGIRHTDETKKKISEASKRLWKKNGKAQIEKCKKAIVCYDKYGSYIKEFDATITAAKELNIHPTNITTVLKGKNHIIKGYHFRYKTDIIEPTVTIPNIKEIRTKAIRETAKKSRIPIEVSYNGAVIGIYESGEHASQETGLPIGILSTIRLGKLHKPIKYSAKSKYDGYEVKEYKFPKIKGIIP